MPYHAEEEVKVFAGIDVSAVELSVALLRSKEDEETAATFTNTRSGHKALLAYPATWKSACPCLPGSDWELQSRSSSDFASSLPDRNQRGESTPSTALRGISGRA